jgi:formate dehydrogenase major subunit
MTIMADRIKFTLDGKEVTAEVGESIWDVAKRQGTTIPHLCHSGEKGYRADGNCRACMVEIDGERTLAASCVRKPVKAWWSKAKVSVPTKPAKW